MLSIVLSLLASSALTTALPAKRGLDCPGSGAYYVCAANNYRGYCSSDPCDAAWCPDFEPQTCTPKNSGTWESTNPTVPECSVAKTGSQYYVCADNGFKGYCSTDACNRDWCPDYEYRTCTPGKDAPTPAVPECSVAKPGSQYYVCADNGFKGYCSTDACNRDWCPDYEYRSCTPGKDAPAPTTTPPASTGTGNGAWSDPTVCKPGKGYYQVCANGFKGCCTADACSLGYCPRSGDDGKNTPAPPAPAPPAPAPPTPAPPSGNTGAYSDPTICKAGTGYYQVCGNGFKGCCTADACTLGYCPSGTGSTTTPPPAGNNGAYSDPTICKAGTGYYQVCGNGFKGCCKSDACTLGYCPA